MRKRVGIITWVGNTTLNYGCAFQATAMQEMLKREGYEPVTIDFLGLGRNKKECAAELLKCGVPYTRTWYAFHRWYKKYVNLSPKCMHDDDIVQYAQKNCDILLCGSDAIWGDDYSMPRLFWDYEALDNLPHVAYAAGIHMGGVSYDMSRVIDKFVAIGGREQRLGKFLGKYNREIETVLDPTLAVGDKFWQDRAADRLIEEDYIVCYMLSKIEYHKIAIERVKRKFGVNRIVYINADFIDKPCNQIYSDYGEDVYKGTVGPGEFLSLIKYATAVCTDSYHGMCFSIVFRREFFAFGLKRIIQKDADARFASLMSYLDLSNRYIQYTDEIDELEDLDWEFVIGRLEEERNHSRQFLHKALQLCEKKQ